MWKAVRSGEPGGYAYLAWMHHNGFIGGHLPPHLQPKSPEWVDPGHGHSEARLDEQDAGAGVGDNDNKKSDGTKKGGKPRTEEGMRGIATVYWGLERLEKTRGGGGVGSDGNDAEEIRREEGSLLRPGEDIWGGVDSDETWEWTVIGGGVSGANAAADLYIRGILVRNSCDIPGALCLGGGGYSLLAWR